MKLFSHCLGILSGILASFSVFSGCDKREEAPVSVYGPPSYFGIQENEKQANSPGDTTKANDESNVDDENNPNDENPNRSDKADSAQ